MARGTVRWFSQEKGYGFITPDEGGEDLFVAGRGRARGGSGLHHFSTEDMLSG